MKMPADIIPMAATMGKEPFNDARWTFEIKLDGFRIVSYINEGVVKLQTRNLKDYTGKFTQITSALQKLKHNAIVDGEVVMLNANGISDFNMLERWRTDADGPLYYFVFDLLWLDGKDYMKEPLIKRKIALKKILPRSHVVIYQSDMPTYGTPAFKMAQGEGLEGVVAKKLDSIYKPGTRTKDWVKLKVTKEDVFIVCGYTKTEGTGMLFSSLILGEYHNGRLQYGGEAGTGFSDKLMKEIVEKTKPGKCPFDTFPRFNYKWRKKKPDVIVWCRPEIVCLVRYTERTAGGELRHASFKGLRPDLKAVEVVH